ncbi:MAG: tRNA uridine-5-carboxymethylaminomethyl(34) synthesis GTPase MnmE, partial [Ktedonobacterales bacterium]
GSHARDEPPPSHLLTYGHVVNPADGEIVDEVLAAFMRAPRTYTREDVVEVSAHGGPLILRRILELALAAGARLARPGEMTLRAFLNGRLDLAQAEGVMALINAETDAGRRLAMRQLRGALSQCVHAAREQAMAALARIEASIDFPEEEVPAPDPTELRGLIEGALAEVERLLAGADQGRLLREGLRVAIVGRHNVGKSSLLNVLLGSDRAIVTAIPGTTRDTIEERAAVEGLPLRLIDTAGMTHSDDPVERLGVERSRAAAQSADLLLLVLDASQPLTEQDRRVADELRALRADDNDAPDGAAPPVLLALNKADLPPALDELTARELWPGALVTHTSCVDADGTASLRSALAGYGVTNQRAEGDPLVASVRHQAGLRLAGEHLRAALATLMQGIPLDFVSIDLRAALDALGEITGETATADLLDTIFSEFCIGK